MEANHIKRIVIISLLFLSVNSINILQTEIENIEGLGSDIQLNALAANWTEIPTDPTPPGRIHTAMAFDSKRGNMIMFGGNIEGGLANDTWSFDTTTNSWTQLFPINNPPVKNYHKLVYHPVEDLVILFGGITGDGTASRLTQNTWAYNISANTWTDLQTTSRPSARRDPAMVYDPDSNKIILFGGQAVKDEGGLAQVNDLWQYDYATNQWTELLPSIAPPARQDHKLVYDSTNKVFILFGGTTDGRSTFSEDTWAYSYVDNEWTDLAPADIPIGRRDFGMVYNAVSEKIVMFGGTRLNDETFAETWTFDYPTNTWKQLHTINAGIINGGKSAYDSQNNKVVYFSDGDRSEKTWILNFYDGPEYTAPPIVSTTASTVPPEEASADEPFFLSNNSIVFLIGFSVIVLLYNRIKPVNRN